MKITDKQAHVLENLDRVKRLPYKLVVNSPMRRYQLDDWECTAQITGLVVKQLVQDRAGKLVLGPRLTNSHTPSLPPVERYLGARTAQA